MLSIYCPNCGATVKFDKDQIPTFCSFCGAHLPDMTDFVKDNIRLEVDKRYLNLDRQRHQMRIEELRKESKAKRTPDGTVLVKAVVCIIVLLLTAIFVFVGVTYKP